MGAIVHGEDGAQVLRQLASALDRRLLLVRPEHGTVWGWLGGRRRAPVGNALQRIAPVVGSDVTIALGEPAPGVAGWRLTHEQADAALRVGRPGHGGVIRYSDVGLLASISQDRLLADSLRQQFLSPLIETRDGGTSLRKTLRAYFTAGRNVSSAASALGVSRQTVGNRLRTIEEKLNRTLESCAPEMELALRLDELSDRVSAGSPEP
ncbi:MAG: helix-turn-helix domain-containing protein [Solirubrobacterales bacterium]